MTALLYGDYRNGMAVTREETMEKTRSLLHHMAEAAPLLGDIGNLYALPYLSFVNNLPTDAGGSNVIDRDVPFVQMVLHGYMEYTSLPLNTAPDSISLC